MILQAIFYLMLGLASKNQTENILQNIQAMMSQNDDAKSHHFGMQYFLLEICCALTLMGQIFTPWMPRALGSYPYTCPYRYYIEVCPTSR